MIFFNEKINKLGSIDGLNSFLYKTMSKNIFEIIEKKSYHEIMKMPQVGHNIDGAKWPN